MRITAAARRTARGQRRWALIRVALGFLQVFGASLGIGLLLMVGATGLTLLVVLLTGLCTTLSILLFGGRSSRHGIPSRRR